MLRVSGPRCVIGSRLKREAGWAARRAMPVLQGGDWYYVEGEKPGPLKEPEQKAENKAGHRPLNSYQLPKWVYHPERVNRRIVINKEDYFGMAADGLRNFDLWNVAHVAAYHDDLKLLSLATLEQCKEPNRWGMTPMHMTGLGQHPYGPSLCVLWELIQIGAADPEALNSADQSPWHIAQRMQKPSHLKKWEKVVFKGTKPDEYEARKQAQLRPRGKFARALGLEPVQREDTSKPLPVCLVFPGQGSQYVGMLQQQKDLPVVRQMLTKAKEILGYDLEDVIAKGPEEKLSQTKYCQPAMCPGAWSTGIFAQAQGRPKMKGADHLETAPFLQMEPKTWPSNQQSWPVTQPEPTWDVFHLWPCGACVPFLAMIIFPFLVLFFVIFCAMSLVTGILCSGPLSFGCCCLYSWRFSKSWQTDLYQKVIYLAYYFENRGLQRPQVHPKFMPVDDMKPKKKLEKQYLDYGLNIQVPKGGEDQFLKEYYTPKLMENFVEDRLHWLPISMHYASFGPNENPVDYVMSQLSPIYPAIYQEWNDKHSDDALTRICLYGIGAHHVEVECQDGQKFYVVRTNCLSGLPVRDGFESYGGDAYFNEAWRPVMIVDQGLQEDSKVVVRPGDDDWERCKFRFRSSLFSLVTLVDHLYFLHLQLANFFVTSVREQMSESHPIRRFLTPFTYQTISINDNAAHNLVAPRSMGPRCFAMTDQGFNLAFAAAPHLQVWGYEVPAEDGGPLLNLRSYFAYKKRQGVDTEYFRQTSELYEIYHRFLSSYVECYYPTKEALVKDEELLAMAEHFFIDSEAAAAGSMGRRHPWVKIIDADAPVEEAYEFYLDWLASLMWMVTAGHEQMGAVEVYAQDVSWTSFKWLKGATCGTKQTATAQALLMSFTSTPMPKLIGDGDDWSHLFPKASVLAGRTPELCYKKFHEDLKAMSLRCEQYNAEAHTRPFPECFPMYTNNPGVLECSISV